MSREVLTFALQETYIFPVLAKKMPQFKAGARESGEHLKSHKAIHTGECRLCKRNLGLAVSSRHQRHQGSCIAVSSAAKCLRHVTGLDKYEAFLRDALAKPSSYSPETLREVMDSFRDILFR